MSDPTARAGEGEAGFEACGEYRLEKSTGYWVHRLYRVMEREFSRRLAPLRLTPQEWAVLKTVSQRAETPAAIAGMLEMDSSAVTRFLDRLQRKGLLDRQPHPEDRRSTTLELTSEGLATIHRAAVVAQGVNDDILAPLDQGERSEFLGLLQRLVEGARGALP